MHKKLFIFALSVIGIGLLSFALVGCGVNITDTTDAADMEAVDMDAGEIASAKNIIRTTKTIVIPAKTHRDFKGATIICSGMGDGSQKEGQKPAIKLEKGASISNVTIGSPAVDGVHCYGDNTLTNVNIPDIGEDAFTVKSSGTITINGGSAFKGADKCFQVNAPCVLNINNFRAGDIGKLCRQLGGSTFTMTLRLNNVTVNNVKEAIFRTDSKTSRVYYRNLKVTNFKGKNGWWYGKNSQATPY